MKNKYLLWTIRIIIRSRVKLKLGINLSNLEIDGNLKSVSWTLVSWLLRRKTRNTIFLCLFLSRNSVNKIHQQCTRICTYSRATRVYRKISISQYRNLHSFYCIYRGRLYIYEAFHVAWSTLRFFPVGCTRVGIIKISGKSFVHDGQTSFAKRTSTRLHNFSPWGFLLSTLVSSI